ncbi:MAG: hypothetical protein FJX42_02985 [Alphaproteobacteria bacterium]|nr:hypothetical protein [Alphaproteobacteria bacterium]
MPRTPPHSFPVDQIHGTVVAIGDKGVLLRGVPGAGKSDLALRLMDSGARLVADDRVDVRAQDGRLIARPPRTLAGLIEARGIGIVRVRHRARAEVRLVVDIVKPEQVERMPENETCTIAGIRVPRLKLAAAEASAPAKVRLALAHLSPRRGGGKQ